MKAIFLFNILLASLLLNACKKDELATFPGTVPAGAYVYTSYDSLGAPIVQGWFTLLMADSFHITGEWHFTQIGGGNDIGPQIGDGNLVGTFESGTLWIELNPQFRDNNLSLRGKVDDKSYNGTWAAIGFGGIMNRGTFRSSKN